MTLTVTQERNLSFITISEKFRVYETSDADTELDELN